MTFGDFVRARRKELGMTLVQFTALSGVYAANMSNYETGKALPEDEGVIARIAAGLKLDEDLLEGLAALDRGSIPRVWSRDAEYMKKFRKRFLEEIEGKE